MAQPSENRRTHVEKPLSRKIKKHTCHTLMLHVSALPLVGPLLTVRILWMQVCMGCALSAVRLAVLGPV